jgi:hypothetical protein
VRASSSARAHARLTSSSFHTRSPPLDISRVRRTSRFGTLFPSTVCKDKQV